ECVREIFTICAGCSSLAAAQRELDAHRLGTKDWISRSGKHHRSRRFSSSALGALLRNVLYIGEVCHKGRVYPGEQPALVEQALWERVQQQLKLATKSGEQHHKVNALHGKADVLLSDLLYCAHCGERMRTTYTSRQGRRHLYYVCRSTKADPKCHHKPVAAVDLEPSVREQLEPILGLRPDALSLQHSLERVAYDARTREVAITLLDGRCFAYTLPLAHRPGVRRAGDEQQTDGRVPRVSRLMALALEFQGLLAQGTVRDTAELAKLGHVSRPRMCQILMLTNLAPAIQEVLLFLPGTRRGRDRITESRLRRIASLIDWQAQIQAFRSHWAGSRQ
ncbi:MAG: recombinase zinc beta ribbon domain-containing protein, partial [Acidobacteriaceae bacterium]|nr:recombinase zinc beta ribbon domain-containing protein [Acidobacteriaceae bacterium]